MTILLVRHADAGSRSTWHDDDAMRPLSARGDVQAKALIALLDNYRIDRILTSSYVRCRQTVEPLAVARALQVSEDPALLEGASERATMELVDRLMTTDAVLCSHGDVIGALVSNLERLGLEAASKLRWQKGSVWALKTVDGVFTTARYFPPPL